jgi:hypothetical protein
VVAGPEGVPKHDRVTPLLDDGEARHPILGMSMRSLSSVSKDLASASGQAHIQVLAPHSQLRMDISCVHRDIPKDLTLAA